MKYRNIAIALLMTTLLASHGYAQQQQEKKLLRDGAALSDIDGRVVIADSNTYLFKADAEITDGKVTLEPGATLELLPTAALQSILADANGRTESTYRIWAKVTKYKDTNYLFCVYFLPLSKTDTQTADIVKQDNEDSTVNTPNDILTIPDEVAALLQKTNTARPQQPAKKIDMAKDTVLINRTGIITTKHGKDILQLDAMGQGMGRMSFELLPGEALDITQRLKSSNPEKMRFRISGLVTNFHGKKYMLLQRASRVYSHGNFTR